METQNQQPRLIVFSVYDSKVKQFTSPNTARTVEEAIRSFGAAASKEGHDFRTFASDYTLYMLGHFAPDTGIMYPSDRTQIASATEFAPKQ